jgi:glycosyltransferase involved in cell wall biosynthesis
VIVVDNDEARSGAPSVETARAQGMEVSYVCEPRRGIAVARNRAVAAANGEWIAFLDDDEEADPQWLVHLWCEVRQRGADAGIGPVVPRCSDAAPRWLVDGGFFDRRRFPTGTILHAGYTRTGNALIRRRALSSVAGPFDERYDLTGGEDTNLFARLIAGGARVIAVDSAVVYEHLPAPRTTLRSLLRRRFVHGIGMGRLDQTIDRKDSLLRRGRLVASVAFHGSAGLLLVPLSSVRALRLFLWAAQQLGRLAFLHGYAPKPYESAPGADVAAEPATEHAT